MTNLADSGIRFALTALIETGGSFNFFAGQSADVVQTTSVPLTWM